MPIYAFGSLLLFVGAVLTLDLTGHGSDSPTFIALVVATIPSIVAALFAERSSRDIRNGVVQEKARHGAAKAIEESGAAEAAENAATAVTDNAQAVATLISMLENHLDKESKKP